MAYDKTKDVLVKNLGAVEGTDLTAEIRSYDGGKPKVRFSKEVKRKGEMVQRSQFSVPQDEAYAIGDFLMKVDAENGTGQAEEATPDEEMVY
jgi:hypothetical protein